MKLMIALTSLCLFAGALPACASLMYTAEPMEARIIDADTKQPLEGAVVVAHWQLERGSVGGSYPAGQLMVMETVTDKDGKFNFPGFGPKPAITSHLVHKDPALILFKSGYHYRVLTNQYTSDIEQRTRMVRRSEWNGKTIELIPFKGTQEEYAEHVHQLDNNLEWARYGKDCEWKKIPRMLIALHRTSEYFNSQGVKVRGWQIGARIRRVTDVRHEKQCGSPQEFFKDYQP